MPPSISEPPAEAIPTPEPRRLWPADYYSSATPAPVMPRGVSYGCGAASVLVIIIVFAGGAWLSGGGFMQFMDLALGMSVGEMRGMYAPDVTAQQKRTLETEIETMRARMRERKVAVGSLQPFLQSLQKSIRDEKVTPAEVQQLTADARRAAQGKK